VTSARLLARNTLLNVFGQVTPLVVALLAIPVLIRVLGTQRFGILTLAWAVIGYFSLFDLGIGRALTQQVSRALGTGEDAELTSVSWTALLMMMALGAAGGVVLAAATPWLVERGLNVPPELQGEARQAFYLLALSLPFVVTTAGLRGLLEAHQHFGLVTALRLPYALFNFVGPLLVVPFTRHLGTVVGVLVLGRVATWLAHLALCLRRYAFLRRQIAPRRAAVGPLLRTGGWMTVSNVVSPLMVNLDRFLIGALLSMAAVTYYVTPYEAVTKLLVVPGAFLNVLFPAFAVAAVQDRTRLVQLYDQGLRAVLLVMFPITLVLVAFAREGLQLWVGADFARESTVVLQWLAVGVYVNSLGQVPYTLLQGVGRADVPAKLHLVELPVYVAAIWWLTRSFGLAGAGMAWTLRLCVDTGVLLWLTRRHLAEARREVARSAQLLVASLVVLAAVALPESAVVRATLTFGPLIVFAAVGWAYVLQPAERTVLRRVLMKGDRGLSLP
jgi:O-antigen/teichoic acid export membrane protein